LFDEAIDMLGGGKIPSGDTGPNFFSLCCSGRRRKPGILDKLRELSKQESSRLILFAQSSVNLWLVERRELFLL